MIARTVGPGTARGITLLEVMVAAALLSVVISASLAGLLGANQASERVRRVGDVQETSRLALETIAADLRVAGMGAQLGVVGVGPLTGAVWRVPVIYSGVDTAVVDTFGATTSTMQSNSVFIISGQPATGVLSGDGAGMVGAVVQATLGPPATVFVSCFRGTTAISVDCSDVSALSNFGEYTLINPAGVGFQPLLIGDFRNAVYVRPIGLTSPVAPVAPPVLDPRQQLTFTEQSMPSFSPDPRAPTGFAAGAVLQRARVLHYYLWPSSDGTYYELRRSQPILADVGGTLPCRNTDAPFLDETNAAGPAGVPIGSGPISSLQIRYVADPGAAQTANKFSIIPVGPCDGAAMPTLREIRVQVVARSLSPDKTTDGTLRMQYSTPAFETSLYPGAVPTNPAYVDPYPRRTFSITVVPRNLQGVRL